MCEYSLLLHCEAGIALLLHCIGEKTIVFKLLKINGFGGSYREAIAKLRGLLILRFWNTDFKLLKMQWFWRSFADF